MSLVKWLGNSQAWDVYVIILCKLERNFLPGRIWYCFVWEPSTILDLRYSINECFLFHFVRLPHRHPSSYSLSRERASRFEIRLTRSKLMQKFSVCLSKPCAICKKVTLPVGGFTLRDPRRLASAMKAAAAAAAADGAPRQDPNGPTVISSVWL